MSKQSNNTKTEFEQYCDAQNYSKEDRNFSDEQIEAITCTDKRVLVLAGAGSGKTKSLVEHIKYLHHKGAEANKILAITFSRNSCDELKKRLSGNAEEKWLDIVSIKTFNSLGYHLLTTYGQNKNINVIDDKYKRASEEGFESKLNFYDIMRNSLSSLFEAKKIDINDLKWFLIDNTNIEEECQTNNEEIKHIEKRKYTTMNGENVYSKSEMFIADWFKMHNIEYKYEEVLRFEDTTIHPDFYLPNYALYIEHISDLSYDPEGRKRLYEKDKLKYAYTLEDEFTSFKKISSKLTDIIKRMSGFTVRNPKIDLNSVFSKCRSSLNDFFDNVQKVIDIIKSEYISLPQLKNIAVSENISGNTKTFYAFAIPLIEQYLKDCDERSCYEFNDLIVKAISLINDNKDNKGDIIKYKYILVDEFQDVNNLQIEFLKSLISPDTHLFCVGDDWQSIYSFRGANPHYIVDFKKVFKDNSVSEIELNCNFRSQQNIVDLGNFIMRKNKNKTKREIKSSKDSLTNLYLYIGKCSKGNEKDIPDKVNWCADKIEKLYTEYPDLKPTDILFLYRKSFQANPYKVLEEKASFKTIHSAKGLEAKYVFIIGLDGDTNLFPDLRLSNNYFSILKKDNLAQKSEEERRVFYVAVTRAKEGLYLVSSEDNASSYVDDILEYGNLNKDKLTIERAGV